jgi:hypothetical protein
MKNVIGVLSRDHLGLTQAQYDSNCDVYKDLDRVWEDGKIQSAHPNGGTWNRSNTLLIDDTMQKGETQPYNIVVVPSYQPKIEGKDPRVLQKLFDMVE